MGAAPVTSEVEAALTTLATLPIEYQDVVALPDVDRAQDAVATLRQHIETLEALAGNSPAYQLARRIEELERERDRLRGELASAYPWSRAAAAEARLATAAEALREIVDKYEYATADLDAFEDHGGHVGIARHNRVVLQGLGACADIARRALSEIEGERPRPDAWGPDHPSYDEMGQ